MLKGLFGDGSPGRVFVRPGTDVSAAVLQAHARGHQQVPGSRLAGKTANFVIFSDSTAAGDAAAQAMLKSAEDDYSAVQQWFGGLTPPHLPFYVYADPDAGGAYHITCAGTDVHVLPDPVMAPGFLVAEVVEVFQDALGNGWDCGHTNGESLSRVLAFDRHPEIASDFTQTEQDWWSQGHQDYVNDNSADDRNQVASGCGDLFLYYLHGQLTFSWHDIVAAGGETLGKAYQGLTGYDPAQGFTDFTTLLAGIDRGGSLALPASGDPFPIKP
ncbi:MAG: hypothetical protein E6H92_05915 [Chloroflexi bacterium]|nr:MAG: hypothetical protein E6H92_05915 [Chloroflexota bacterium]